MVARSVHLLTHTETERGVDREEGAK
jgi:hypothetical protein